jgi:ppGpp synthetase/RelA/SpoT-type nucleotidyltranferase
MARSIPQYARTQVDDAGALLGRDPGPLDADQYFESLEIINNWRTSHSFPLNTFQIWLKKNSGHIDSGALVAQRIKRLTSIQLKLERFPSIRLSQMQDIGGCRAVLRDVMAVGAMVDKYKSSGIKHKLDHVDDYIAKPKPSGYRGVHMIYRYFSDRNMTYNGLKVEVQIRSTLQHAWATAVETVGTFTKQALKSSLGESDWLRFFALMGS